MVTGRVEDPTTVYAFTATFQLIPKAVITATDQVMVQALSAVPERDKVTELPG